MNNKTSYLDLPCERCGDKKILIKVRKAILQNLSSTSEVEYSQIACANTTCQKKFELDLVQRTLKVAAIKLKREEAKAARAKH